MFFFQFKVVTGHSRVDLKRIFPLFLFVIFVNWINCCFCFLLQQKRTQETSIFAEHKKKIDFSEKGRVKNMLNNAKYEDIKMQVNYFSFSFPFHFIASFSSYFQSMIESEQDRESG